MVMLEPPARTISRRAWNQAFERLNNLRWETRLGISTRGIIEVDKPDAVHYATIHYSTVCRVLRHLSLNSSDTFIDVGCGKGRILCCAARHPCKQVVGVEFSREFCRQARINAAQMRGRMAPVLVHNAVAGEFDYREATALFFFCPFGASTFDAVLHKLDHDSRHRRVRLAFVNASENQDKILAEHSWLELYDHWNIGRGGDHSVSFYRRTG